MAEKSKAEDFIFAAGVLIVSWVMLFADAPFRLDFKEQISIFLLDADRISWYLSNPAVVSSVIGDWLTQLHQQGYGPDAERHSFCGHNHRP